jgi:KH/beta-lactamase-domain protein
LGGQEILDRVLSLLPSKADIGESRFEAANAVVFTRSHDFLMKAHEYLRDVAKEMKLRIEARADRSILLPTEDAQDQIKEILKDSGITDIFFDAFGSTVIIEVKRPSDALANGAEKLIKIKDKTSWTPIIQREPPMKSDIINTIRHILTKNSKERAAFLHKTGMRIYQEGKPIKWIRASFLGGAKEVGRSAILLQTNESRVLMDCGVNVASTDDAYPVLDAPEFDINRLDATVITHPHLDHTGFVPFLFKYGYDGPVYMTPPALPLSVLLQLDLIDVAYKEGNTAPYASKEIERMVLHTITLPFEEVMNITPDVRLTMYNAGHILGSALLHFHIGEGLYNLVYTGDLKYGATRLHEPASNVFPRAEAVIIESTYGGNNDIQEPTKESEAKIIETVKKCAEQGGKILIPTLGSGRAQEIMIMIQENVRNGSLPEIPVYVDGIVWDATAIYTTYPEYLHRNIRKQVFSTEENPLLDPIFRRVGGQKERENVVSEAGPGLILATSGMLTGGPSVFYLSRLAPFEKNAIIFVNYLGEGTLGRMVQRGSSEVVINRARIPVKLQVITASGFSAHSDRNQLMNFLKRMEPRPGIVLPVHGDPKKITEFANAIRTQLKISTKIPSIMDAIRLK